MKNIFSKIFIIYIGLFSSLPAEGSTISNIRWTAYHYIDETYHEGLKSPFYHNLFAWEWPGNFVDLWFDYSDFRKGFDYLHWWCDTSFSRDVTYYNEKIEENVNSREIPRYQKNIQDYCAKQVKVHEILTRGWDDVQIRFSRHYDNLESFQPKISFQRGLLYLDEGRTIEAIDQIKEIINSGELQTILNDCKIKSISFELEMAQGYIETCEYTEAISTLDKIIEKDPENIDAYFARAIAYFETGNFDFSLADYIASGFRSIPIDTSLNQDTLMAAGLSMGIVNGGNEGLVEFVPSMLSSLQGLGHGLWAFAREPIKVSKDFIQSAISCVEYVKTHSTQEVADILVPELTHLVSEWATIDNFKRGELTGYIIGKYGIEIFACAGVAKATKLYRELKRSDALLTLETFAASPANKNSIVESAAIKSSHRNKSLKEIQIHWDRQNKHIPGSHNYIPGRSTISISEECLEKLMRERAGSGLRVGREISGIPGYKERINFNEVIGEYIKAGETKGVPTTVGTIHYDSLGYCHVIPAKPQ